MSKVFGAIKDIDANSLDPAEIQSMMTVELDSIGEKPSGVPAAVLEQLEATRYRHLLDVG
jgi:hypothetical protein